jgi:hypothetical protein
MPVEVKGLKDKLTIESTLAAYSYVIGNLSAIMQRLRLVSTRRLHHTSVGSAVDQGPNPSVLGLFLLSS